MGACCDCCRRMSIEKRRKDAEKESLISKTDEKSPNGYGAAVNKQQSNDKKSENKEVIIDIKEGTVKKCSKSDAEEKQQKQPTKPKQTNDKIQLPLDCELGKLVQSLPMQGIITYEKENTFWLIQLGDAWQNNQLKFAELTDTFSNEQWYKDGIERGKQWANLVNETDINIKTVPPTAISGLHITLTRMDINDKNKPDCFIEGATVQFKAKRLICHPPFRSKPQNLPGQKMEDNEYRYYATHWMALEVEFVDFEYETRFPPHVSLCNIAVKLKTNDVDKLDKLDSN